MAKRELERSLEEQAQGLARLEQEKGGAIIGRRRLQVEQSLFDAVDERISQQQDRKRRTLYRALHIKLPEATSSS